MKLNFADETVSLGKSDNSIAFRAIDFLIKHAIRVGSLKVIDVYDGVHHYGDNSGELVCIRFNNSSAYHKILLNPDLYLGEAYVNGDICLEKGSIRDFLELILKNIPSLGDFVAPTTRLLNLFEATRKSFKNINNLKISRSNVSHHYDLSEELYKLFLDKEWQYSCGYFPQGNESLEEAQIKKMQHVVSKLLINKDHHVLDIGCGWGGLARYIAKETGALVTGITLSQEQFIYAKNKTREEGLDDLVTFKICDYRNLNGVFDRVVSVGMFEHVGVDYYKTFFDAIYRLMRNDGVALLHSIGRVTKPTPINPWIQKYIFPGGYIPSLSEVIPHVENKGLILNDLEILRLHYAKTINHWLKRFEEKRDHVRSLYDERFCRMWEFYLASSEASFKHSGNMVFHMQLTKEHGVVPLTRNYLYES